MLESVWSDGWPHCFQSSFAAVRKSSMSSLRTTTSRGSLGSEVEEGECPRFLADPSGLLGLIREIPIIQGGLSLWFLSREVRQEIIDGSEGACPGGNRLFVSTAQGGWHAVIRFQDVNRTALTHSEFHLMHRATRIGRFYHDDRLGKAARDPVSLDPSVSLRGSAFDANHR